MASGIARERVRTTTTVELRKMAAMYTPNNIWKIYYIYYIYINIWKIYYSSPQAYGQPFWVQFLQIIGWKRHAALVYHVLFWYMTSCYAQLTPVKSSYPLTSITWLYRRLKFIAHRGHVFCLSWPLTKCWFSLESPAHFKLTCWKQSRVAWKCVNSNPGLKVNQIINVSSLQMLSLELLFCDYLTQNRRLNNTQKTPPQSYKPQSKIQPHPGLA